MAAVSGEAKDHGHGANYARASLSQDSPVG
jgi:hypothetical protein